MKHIEDGTLRAYLDGELDAARLRGAATHLATCNICASRLEEVDQTGLLVGRSLALLDPVEPLRADWRAVERRIAADSGGRPGFRLARAAGIVMLLGGGAAAALLPGSPLRRAAPADEAAPESATIAPARAEAGIRPPAGLARLSFVVEAPVGTEVVVELTPSASGIFADPGSSFASAEDEIRAVVSEGPVRIEMSTRIAEVSLQINGRSLVEVRSGRIVDAPEEAERMSGPTGLRFRVQ